MSVSKQYIQLYVQEQSKPEVIYVLVMSPPRRQCFSLTYGVLDILLYSDFQVSCFVKLFNFYLQY